MEAHGQNKTALPSVPKNKNSRRWLYQLAGDSRNWVLLTVGLGLLSGLLLIAQAGLLANIIQGAFIDRLPLHLLLPLFIAAAVVVLLRTLVSWAREVAGFTVGARVRDEVRSTLLDHIFKLGPAWTAQQRTGELASVVLEQVDGLQDFFALYLPQLALAGLIPVAIAAFIFPISWSAGGLLLLSAPMIPFFMILVGMGAENIAQKNYQALSRLSAHFLDTIQGLATLKLFGQSRAEGVRLAQSSAEYRRQTMRVLRVAFLSSAVLEFFSSMAIALVAVYLGMRYLGYVQFGDYGRELNLSHGFFILLLAPEFFLPLRELGSHYHARATAIGAAEEIRKVLSTPPPASPTGAPPPNDFAAVRIECDQVGFEYPGERKTALRDISFTLSAGECLAVVGASGAGKTTLLNLLMGVVVPHSGHLLINGRMIDTLGIEYWRRHVSYVGQSPVLFFGTVYENIRLGNPNASDAEVQAAAEAARVWDFCQRLPEGLNTPVGDQGAGLSRGQIQRVALARALLKDAPLLLLDEPTAGLDAENQRKVMDTVWHLAAHRTVLMATHRLETIRSADRVLVLQNGRMRAWGRFGELTASGDIPANSIGGRHHG